MIKVKVYTGESNEDTHNVAQRAIILYSAGFHGNQQFTKKNKGYAFLFH